MAALAGFAPVALAKRPLLVRAVADGRRVGLQFGPGLSEAGVRLRSSGGAAAWCHRRRMWVVPQIEPERLSHKLKALFSNQPGFEFSSMEEDLNVACNCIEPDFFTEVMDVQLFPLVQGGFAVSSEYDLPLVDVMRSMKGLFHRYASAWEIKKPMPAIMQLLEEGAGISAAHVFVHQQPVILEKLVAPSKAGSPISVMAATPDFAGGADGEVLGSGFLTAEVSPLQGIAVDEEKFRQAALAASLRSYQEVGARHLLSQSSALLADDMGLGKTRQAIVASFLASGDGRILVVCPAALRINWEREIRSVYPAAAIGLVANGRLPALYACKWVIASFEGLGSLVPELELGFEVMTIDEAHYLKEHEAGRTLNAFLLGQRIARRFLLTGTPLLNLETEMHTLLRLSGHPMGALTLKEFKASYAGSAEKRAALSAALAGWMLRRSKDVLTELGSKSHQVCYVSPTEGLGSYQAILADMSMMVMPKITKLRQKLESLKIDYLIETVQALAEDDKVIIFVEYIPTVEVLKESFADVGIGAVSLTGPDRGSKRQKAVDAFQNDSGVKVFIGTTRAAGVGYTLTAANYVILASQPWTPAQRRQAEDRAYRMGQKRDVVVKIPLIANTIDEQVNQLLMNKELLERDVVESVKSALMLH